MALENATSFSSPQTKVKVTGHALPDGRVLVEIHDTGIGLSPEDLSAINERLASPPTVDVSVSRRMGLFVVGRLSLRHGKDLTWSQVLLAANTPMLLKSAMVDGRTDLGVMASGQVAGVIDDLPSCEELVERIMAQAAQTMSGLPVGGASMPA